MVSAVNEKVLAVRAPNRIDFAGGTLDVFPLFLLEEGARTINSAISIYSHAYFRKRKDKKIVLCSKDCKQKKIFSHLDKLPKRGPLFLLAEAVRFFKPEQGYEITTWNEAPQGSGLGASSALLVALMKGMSILTGRRMTRLQLMHDASLAEAKVIGIPTGKQDYGAALFGGFRSYRWKLNGYECKALALSASFKRRLARQSLLVFTGVSHFSAKSNWEILKRYVEKKRRTQRAVQKIKECAKAMEKVLLREDIERMAEVLDREWFYRKQLALEVNSPRIERMERVLRKQGLMGMKACGAGGGGCIYLLVEAGKREEVAEKLQKIGGKVLPFSFVGRGIAVEAR